MRTAKTVSITLPPDLLLKAKQCAAEEHRTMSELFREALRRYVGSRTIRLAAVQQEWNAAAERSRTHVAALGITEADVERLSDEYRRERNR